MSTMVTSCGVLVMSSNRHLLLGHASGGRHWDIFKGLQEAGESPRETALRELQEESGLKPEAATLVDLGSFDYLPRKNLYLFAMMSDQLDASSLRCSSTFVDRFGRVRTELDAFEWVPFERVEERCGKGMTRVLTSQISLTGILERVGQVHHGR